MGAAMGVALLLVLAAGCKDKGGELREATQRRRAEMDTTPEKAADTTAAADTGYALPAFVGDTPATAARPDSAAKDSATAGSAPKTEWATKTRDMKHASAVGIVRGFRVAGQDGFDRLVLDFGAGPIPGWHVGLVDQPPAQCGSGETTQVAGQAWLLVRLRTAQAHDDQGAPTLRQRDVSLGLPVMRQLAVTCDFEGDVQIVLGLSAATPFRVMELQNPARLVVDVQQQP